AVLNGKAYNSQYGWNVGGFFSLPAGAAIWIELLDSTPNLEIYSGWGRTGSYVPILGTGGTSRLWKWNGVMVHNTYAVLEPPIGRLFADYHIYFGEANSGSRAGFADLADTTVHLEWMTMPVENPMAFKFGAVSQTNSAPLCFINSNQFVTNSLAVVNLWYTNAGPCAFQYECSIPLVAVPASSPNGGPATNAAASGSCLALELVSLAGPPDASLGFWEPGQILPAFSLSVGGACSTNRLALSQSHGTPGADPYGCFAGRHLAVNRPGLYCLGFRVVDTSTNGLAGDPIHSPSSLYQVYLQAGLTIASLSRQIASATALFGGEPGRAFYLERSPTLGPGAAWQTVAGPLAGSNRLQTLTDLAAPPTRSFFRLRAM
ncbi:MAG: hypothetical protein NT154_19345, partial [Verrucomicrobia bacterium]|nr:hypothetical protein [Verrucomicrobiota bacterium]